ncbi:cytochrome P450 [Phaeosphaeria sp. MPI-PUGE-AT-0046c]|nr:cytochrome P450 [Phaeosphaeria sp. MPI-PUGE-AT-0046c]
MDEPKPSILGQLNAALTLSSILWLVATWIIYRVALAIYNISPLHPLSRFPGPKIAASSYLYEAYYDWWRVGHYGIVIAQMHKKYGPIVRINPDELHCSDPLFTDEIYTSSPHRIRDKWQHQLNTGGAGPVSVTGFSTVSHELHRAKKAPLSRFFSRAQMLKLESEVHEFANLTVEKMLRSAGQGAVFDVKEAFNCFTADVISQYCFGEPMGFVAQEGWEPNFATWVKSFFKSAYMMRHNVLARKMAQVLPFMADYLGDDVRNVMRVMNVTIPEYIRAALENPENGRVFAEVMGDKGDMSEEEKYRYNGEGFNFLLAGTETTAAILTVLTYHLLSTPSLLTHLQSTLPPTAPQTWLSHEKNTHLTALLLESLRLMPGVTHRSARIARLEDLHYASADGTYSYLIPRGTPIGMTSVINHCDEKLFPAPDEFKPERWLKADGTVDTALKGKLLAFGKGGRSCVGENLAYCELYIMAALMATKVLPRARLVDTTVEDISYDHDLIVLQTKKGSISVKIEID